jgi:hypothetical protein
MQHFARYVIRHIAFILAVALLLFLSGVCIRSYFVGDGIALNITRLTGSEIKSRGGGFSATRGRLIFQVQHSRWPANSNMSEVLLRLSPRGVHFRWTTWPSDQELRMREDFGIWSKLGFSVDTLSLHQSGMFTLRVPILALILISAIPVLLRLRRWRRSRKAHAGFAVEAIADKEGRR